MIRPILLALLLPALLLLPVSGWAAVTMTALTGGTDTVGGTSIATASYTPSANKLILVGVCTGAATAANNVEPTLSGNSLTWDSIATNAYDTVGNARRCSLFRSMGAFPSTGALTFTFSATQNSEIWSIAEFDGVDTSGTNGSGAIIQSAINSAGTGTSLIVTLGAFGSANNATYGLFSTNVQQLSTPGAGFTEIHDASEINETIGMISEWRVDNATSVDASWATSAGNGGIAVEIKAAVAITCPKTLVTLGVGC